MAKRETQTSKKSEKPAVPARRRRGFEAASNLLSSRIRVAGQKRGFDLTRVLTHWNDVAGDDLAQMATPVSLRYGREGGFGATLTVLVSGSHAPLVEMQKPKLLDRLNACYGYAAISRIRVTQTAAQGFAEDQSPFGSKTGQSKPQHTPQKAAQIGHAADELAQDVEDPGLRSALERLGRNVLAR